MSDRPVLSVRDLTTYFEADEGTTRAVDGVSFDVWAGKTLGIVGETGCGKSVTARSILRLVDKPGRIVDGEIRLDRNGDYVDVAQLDKKSPELREIRGGEIGLVFQEPMSSFSPVHTVGNQIIEAIQLHSDLTKPELTKRAIELLELVGVPEPESRLKAYPWQFSGGQLQRAMIAMAMAGDPRLLILDEPTTALDVITQAHILDLVRELQEKTGLAIIIITHDLGVVAQIADEVAVMYLGRVVERGPVADIFAEPKHPYTRALLESIPSRHEVAGIKLPTIAGSIPHPFNRPAGCSFHPRCTSAIKGLCDTVDAPELVVDLQHEVTCHLFDSTRPEVVEVLHSRATTTDRPVAPAMRAADVQTNGQRKPTSSETLLEVQHLNKDFAARGRVFGKSRGKVQAVRDVSFDIKAGETLALVGESGSGKTTTSRCIIRAITPDSGSVEYQTEAGGVVDLATLSTRRLRPLRAEIQMIFQDPYSSLNPRMPIADIVGEPLLLNGVKNRVERNNRVEELLGLVGIRKEHMRRYPHAFSGGQRQRIGIARALALNPRLVVADEPVSALDVSVQAQTLNLLMDLQNRLGLTYLFVSHDLSVVRHISDRIGVMYDGELVELGEANAVLSRPQHPYTAALLAAIPKPDPATRARFDIPKARPMVAGAEKAGCAFERRCAFAIERCKVERPELQLSADGRQVRCHRAHELTLGEKGLEKAPSPTA